MVHPTSPTSTQYALFLCFMLLGPAMGVMAGFLAHQRARGVAGAALMTLVASWSGWVVSCVCAAVMFPTYPRSGVPSEPIAMLFVVPGFVTGGLALAWVYRSARARGSARGEAQVGLVLTALAALASVGLVQLHTYATMWPARRHLPTGAVVLREDILVDAFIGDFVYEMDARMTEGEFREWMQALELDCVPAGAGLDCTSATSTPDPTAPDASGKTGRYEDGVGHFNAFSS
jgi:hypothetical protein